MKNQPVIGIHFFDWSHFDWYQPTLRTARGHTRWTFQVAFEKIGVDPDRVGHDVRNYVRQFEVMKRVGFDFLLYEWHGNVELPRWKGKASQRVVRFAHPNEHFYEALRRAKMPASMFYDVEIRFASSKYSLAPNAPTRETIVRDVADYFRPIPPSLRARDRSGSIPLVFYSYQFNLENRDKAAWHRFYDWILKGIEDALGSPIVIHWTCGYDPPQPLPMVYAFQHFKSIRPYAFVMSERQSAANADSATFVLHYDCAGVAEHRGETFVVQDVRLLEEQLALVKNTNPSFVFFYGWDEFYEGEHLVPSEEWGTHKLELAEALIAEIRRGCKVACTSALIITDDLLGSLNDATEKLLLNETSLLEALRTIFPVNDTVVSGHWHRRLLQKHDFVLSLNVLKNRQEMARLRASAKTVFNFDPLEQTPPQLARRFQTADFYTPDFEKLRRLFAKHLPLREGVLHIGSYTRERRTKYPWPEGMTGIGTRPTVIEPQELPIKTLRFVASRGLAEHHVRLPIGRIKAIRFIRGKQRPLDIVDGRFAIRYPEIIEIDKEWPSPQP